MILAITMIGTTEAFELGKRLGLTDQALFDVVSTASGTELVNDDLLSRSGTGTHIAGQQ